MIEFSVRKEQLKVLDEEHRNRFQTFKLHAAIFGSWQHIWEDDPSLYAEFEVEDRLGNKAILEWDDFMDLIGGLHFEGSDILSNEHFDGVCDLLPVSFENRLETPLEELAKSEPVRREFLDPSRLRREPLLMYSPSLELLYKLADRKISLDDFQGSRAFEEIVAELLWQDGYNVELGPGTKDGGVDIRASKNLPGIGSIMTVWQAKCYRKNKVGLATIRELADTTRESGASKGIIVTSSRLTKGALDRVTRDSYTLGKVDRDDLDDWIKRTVEQK